MSSVINSVSSRTVSLPLIGAISLPVAIGGAVLIYLAFFRKKGRVTSITTRFGK